jgi:hypothetical protein
LLRLFDLSRESWLMRIGYAVVVGILVGFLGYAQGGQAVAQEAAKDAAERCATIPHLDHPHVVLESGDLRVLVFLPDAKNGYYRAERFDWSGVIGCASWRGHSYWGEWFRHYDPQINDSITGPVEEFRPAEGAQGYSAAQAGGDFVKIGVGVLRKTADAPYVFGSSYPIVDTGQWTVRHGRRSITFRQRVIAPDGVSYLYTKRLSLNRDGSGLRLEHTLRNLGKQPLVTDVYDHDFFMLDGQPTGPGFVLHLSFAPKEAPISLGPKASIEGQDIRYVAEVNPGEEVAGYLTGYESQQSGYSIRLENTRTHTSIEQTADRPISRFYLWSIHSTICPEAYIHLSVPPGQSQKWTIAYRFSGSNASEGAN